MGFPSQEDLKKAVSLNLIKNSNVSCADIDLANGIYRIEIATKKGKPVRKNTRRTIHDEIEIPEDLIKCNKKVKLSVDTRNVNVMIFLTSINHDIFYKSKQHGQNRTTAIQ